MKDLESLKLFGTSLGGPIPATLGNTALDKVWLYGSRFEGPIPVPWCTAATMPSDMRFTYATGETTNLCQPADGCDADVLRRCDKVDRETAALSRFYAAANGPQWPAPSWLRGDPCNQQWWGVTCSRVDSRSFNAYRNLTSLRLSSYPADSPIPSDLADLHDLEVLILSNMNFTGHIHADLATLSNLRTLDLSYNFGLTGELPAAIADLANLERLSLINNDHTGPLPDWLATLPLTYVDLRFNRFAGPIPGAWCTAPPRTLQLQHYFSPSATNDLCLPANCNQSNVGGVTKLCS